MSQTTIIDDVFVGGHMKGRKHTARQILGLENQVIQNGHERFHSKSFIPFVFERDIKGKLIKSQTEKIPAQKQTNLIKIRRDNGFLINSKSSKTDLSIGSKFNLHEISHFRNVRINSHVDKLPMFRKELQRLENRAPESIRMNIKEYEAFYSLPGEDIIEQNHSKQNPIIENSSRNSLKKLVSHPILEQLEKKGQVKSSIDKLRIRANSLKTLMKTNRHRNPQLQQIQRRVKVHYNHPELDRLKLSRNLTFKFLENIDKGDKIFKQKVQEFRSIKQRIKKQMNKL